MNNVIIVKVNGGYFRAEPSCSPEYPGIDVEFISDTDDGKNLSRPRILFEKPVESGELRALIWNNPQNEDCSDEIEFQ